jgi:hypothetical protein
MLVPFGTDVMVGSTVGCVWPPGINTVCVMVNFVWSALVNVIVIPPAGAGTDRLMGRSTVQSYPTAWKAGKMIVGVPTTLALTAIVMESCGTDARITAVPVATPVTGTLTLVLPCGINAAACTVAVVLSVEERPRLRPPDGAGPDKTNVKAWVVPAVIVRVEGVTPILVPAWTGAFEETEILTVALVTPGAVAVMVVLPVPKALACRVAVVVPAENATLAGTVITAGLLDTRVTLVLDARGAESVKVRIWDPPTSMLAAGAKVSAGEVDAESCDTDPPRVETVTSPVADW